MRYASTTSFKMWPPRDTSSGFTIIEMVIAMFVAGMVLLAAYTSYDVQQKAFTVQREAARMEANLRAAMHVIKTDLRNSGRCGQMNESACGIKFISNTKRYEVNNPDAIDMASADGVQSITITMLQDINGRFGNPNKDGRADFGPGAVPRTIRYVVWDSDNNGTRELHRFDSANPGTTMVADGIYDMAFAFAFDNTGPGNKPDGQLDRLAPAVPGDPNTVIWAIDGDEDPQGNLDTNLDNVPDRIIDENDDGDGDKEINAADGGLAASVPMKRVRAVRIWLLARSGRQYPTYADNGTYQVGHRTFEPNEDLAAAVAAGNVDHFRYLMLESSVHLRNPDRS